MSDTDACPDCLRHSWLLALLGRQIEHTIARRGAARIGELLAEDSERLAAEVAPDHATELLATVAGKSERAMRGELAEAGCWAVCRHSERFPGPLHQIDPAPKALIGRGDPRILEALSAAPVVAVVGSRRATSYGRSVARSLGRDLGDQGALVVSGLAFGINACAHRGALDVGAPTVAVLGSGPDVAYPAAHRELWRRIAESGAVLSELPPGAVPWRWTLVYRKLFGPIPIGDGGPYRRH